MLKNVTDGHGLPLVLPATSVPRPKKNGEGTLNMGSFEFYTGYRLV